MSKILSSSEEIYAKERLRFSPLNVSTEKRNRENGYNKCTCGHSRQDHNINGNCTYVACFCSRFYYANIESIK